MNPDREHRLRERAALVAGHPWAEHLLEARAQRYEAEDPVFILKSETKLPRHIIPPFSLRRGEAVELQLNIYDWERFFIPSLRRRSEDRVSFVYIDHFREHFLTRKAESRETWLARAFQTKKRRARRWLKQQSLDPLEAAGTDRLGELATALEWAREKTDTIMLDLAGWTAADPTELHTLLKKHQSRFAWIVTPEAIDLPSSHFAQRCILTQSRSTDSFDLISVT